MTPRLPTWLVYGGGAVALLLAALSWYEYAKVPAHAPMEGRLLGPASAFDPSILVRVPDGPPQPTAGTAFSVSNKGVWLTARHVVAGCRQIALMQAPGRAAEAEIAPGGLAPEPGPPDDIAVLLTHGGAPALALAPTALHLAARGFHPGYPQNRAGEAVSRLIGRRTLVLRSRAAPGRRLQSRPIPVLAWSETGRTDGLKGDLAGLSGAPALDARGQVVGVTLAEAPRRRRLYTSSPEAMRAALARAHIDFSPAAPTAQITIRTYGQVAGALRRALSVAQVVCLDH